MTVKAKNVRTGNRGEKLVKELLESQGYEVQYTDENFCGDLLVYDPVTGVNLRLEVKASNRNIDGKFSFCMYRAGKTNCNHADVVALVFFKGRKSQVRFIDAYYVGHLKNLSIRNEPTNYEGKYRYWWHERMDAML